MVCKGVFRKRDHKTACKVTYWKCCAVPSGCSDGRFCHQQPHTDGWRQSCCIGHAELPRLGLSWTSFLTTALQAQDWIPAQASGKVNASGCLTGVSHRLFLFYLKCQSVTTITFLTTEVQQQPHETKIYWHQLIFRQGNHNSWNSKPLLCLWARQRRNPILFICIKNKRQVSAFPKRQRN